MTIASYQVKAGDIVQVREKARKQLRIQSALNVAAQVGLPDWVDVNDKEFRGVFKSAPGARRHPAGHQREPRRRAVFEVIAPRLNSGAAPPCRRVRRGFLCAGP